MPIILKIFLDHTPAEFSILDVWYTFFEVPTIKEFLLIIFISLTDSFTWIFTPLASAARAIAREDASGLDLPSHLP